MDDVGVWQYMFSHFPPIASGYRGSRKNTTLEDFRPLSNNIHPRQMQWDIKNLVRTTRVATNLGSYFSLVIDHKRRDSHGNQIHGRYACGHHFCCGSRWANFEATCRFRAQSAQFDNGTKSFCECTCPLASQLISVIDKESQNALLCNTCSQLKASAYQISLHKQCAQNQIS
jgi:hypothetical protein